MSIPKTRFRILTLNVWGEGQDRDKRWPLIARAVAELNPDFVGLQEVFRGDDLERVRSAGSFTHAFTPKHKTGLALLTKGAIEKSGDFMLPFSPLEDYRRHVIFARVRLESATVNFYNTHASWKPEDAKTREIQSDALLGFLRGQRKADFDLLTGDLNAVEDTASIKKIKTHFVDLFRMHRPGERGITWSHSNEYALREPGLPERRLDYVMIGGLPANAVKVEEARVVFDKKMDGMLISDHFGTYCDVQVGN